MDTIDYSKPLYIKTVTAKISGTPGRRKNGCNGFDAEKRFLSATCPDEVIEYQSRKKAYENYIKDPVRPIATVIGASIPLVHSVVKGIKQKGGIARKTGAAAGTAKTWALLMGGAFLAVQAGKFLIENIKPLKKLNEDKPGLTWGGVIAASTAAGVTAMNYGNKLFKKVFGASAEEKVTSALKGTSFAKSTKLKNAVKKLESIVTGPKAKIAAQAAITTMAIIGAREIFNLAKIDKDIKQTRNSLKDQRYQASKELLTAPVCNGNPFKAEITETIIFADETEKA